MTTYFELEEHDFLQYQLYMASRSSGLKKMRQRKRITFPIMFLFFGVLLFLVPSPDAASFVCWGCAVLWWLVYPLWDKERYRKRYCRFVQKSYGYRFGKKVSVKIAEEKIIGNDNGFEIIVKPKDAETIVFIPDLILIQIIDNRLILIPAERISEREQFKKALTDFADKWKIPVRHDNNWSWK